MKSELKEKGKKMSLLTLSHIVVFFGLFLAALGGFGTYHFGKKEADKKDKASVADREKLQNRINDLQKELGLIQSSTTSIDEKITLLYESNQAKKHKWNEVKIRAPVIADYVFLLFRSSMGKISGNARLKGSKEIYPFSTLVNNKIPLAVHNLWLPDKKQYQEGPTLEYEIVETSDEKDSLKIFSAGFHMSTGM
jgi:flagellar basal body-associated protein FliL